MSTNATEIFHDVSSAMDLTPLYMQLKENYSEDFLVAGVTYILHEVVYLVFGLIFMIPNAIPALQKYKIQEGKYIKDGDIWVCLKNLFQNHVLITPPMIYFSIPLFKYTGLSTSLPLPSWTTMAWQIFVFSIIEDFLFYWGHRIMHENTWLYQNVHKLHHYYKAPFGIVYEFAHPIEYLVLGFCTTCPLLIFNTHIVTMWIWVVLRQIQSMEVHCGYDFPISPSHWLPLYGGAAHHDEHHHHFTGNYASFYTHCDRIFGTERPHRVVEQKKTK
eukprot:TRINITY_DN483_c0_g1_i1.p1 TRINITY_DN483_c0_g1~~TRINITY_DN483_c0_g1_i1.p1  ORF type:complete len:273 (+),score=59.14 TRINITY_DN483_c0_g1_i1:54-872(+)